MEVKKLLSFLELTLQFRDVYRTIKIPGKVSTENDAEHSYQLALFAWYIATADKLPLDTDKIIRYALVHDFVEVYAGDVDTHTDDFAAIQAKPEREEAARKRLLKEFPEFTEFHDAILEYQEKSTEEARFVYAADKIIAEMNVYLEGNTINVEKGLTVERIRKNKDAKIALSPHLEKYWREFIPLWQELEEKTMPGKNKQSHYRTERK
jgi:putative hydrolase of HD superfamily